MKGGNEGSNGGEEGRGWGDVMVRVLQPGGGGGMGGAFGAWGAIGR